MERGDGTEMEKEELEDFCCFSVILVVTLLFKQPAFSESPGSHRSIVY